jgi:hypothetical protein
MMASAAAAGLPVAALAVGLLLLNGPSFAGWPVAPQQTETGVSGEIASLVAHQLAQCWIAPATPGADVLVVKLSVLLDRNGKLVKPPVVLDGARMDTDPVYRSAAISAREAIENCEPLRLPAEHYDLWKELRLNFDPRAWLSDAR